MKRFLTCPIPVLAYHRVLPGGGPSALRLDEFERQLHWLQQKGIQTLTGSEFSQVLQSGNTSQPSVVITFDDGYLDNWYLVTPLLKKYGMTALLFVITSKVLPQKHRQIGQWQEVDDERYLSWDEIDGMVNSGVFEVHSHTHSHARCWVDEVSAEITRSVVKEDIATSLEILRQRGYQHELQLAWPWGYFRKEWLDDATAMGVNVSYTMRPGTNFPGCDRRMIRRLAGERLATRTPLFFAASTPIVGSALNGAANTWGKLRGRP
jgi:peptidoglycan/xylan/chitin deacetylase (PgdA/CDA1 family)